MDQARPVPPRLADLLDAAWQRLAHGIADRHAPARHLVLATTGRDGAAEARTVVLRTADRGAAALGIHTDSASGKVAELAADPRATLHLWDAGALLQLRLRCVVSIRPGSDAEWRRVPDPSRRAYGGAPPPGQPIPAPDGYDPRVDRARFTVLDARIEEIEILHLGEARHLRALFRRADDWRGTWLAP